MKKILLDTNLLVLYLLGTASRKNIGKHKRIRSFSESDFEVLIALMKTATTFVTSPHILTECSNLLNIGKRADLATVALFVEYVHCSEEICISAKDLVAQPEFAKFGLTDSSIHQMISENIAVLTVDFALYGSLDSLGGQVTNIRHSYQLGGS